MKNMYPFHSFFLKGLIIVIALCVTGCTGVSESNRCEGLPPDEKEACMEELYKAMEEYKQKKPDREVENPRY